jgi:hypothetical protein
MSDASHNLFRETEAARVLRAQLADIIGNDEQCGADMVEAETNLREVIDQAVEMLVEEKMALTGLEQMIDLLQSRRFRIEARIENMRTALGVALEQAGLGKYKHPAVTLSLRSVPRSVVVTEEALIPGPYWKAGEPRLQKRAVLEALKAGDEVPGCVLSNGGVCLALKFS